MSPAPEPVEVEKPGQQPCPHCEDGHQDPRRVPWGVYVGPERDSDGQPMHLRVERTQGSHVADSDAEWLWQLIRTYRDADLGAPEPPEVEAAELAAAERYLRIRSLPDEANRYPETQAAAVRVVLAEFDRLRAELTRIVADCGICRLGGRTLYIDDDCPRHGEGDW